MRQVSVALSLVLIILHYGIGYRPTLTHYPRTLSLCTSTNVLVESSLSPILPALDTHLLNPSLVRNLRMNNEPLVISYLGNELGVSDETLKRIILKHPWVLYLRVTTNIMPTVALLESFGFRKKDIHQLISQAPSILGINANWTLPEKLLSLRAMYGLTPEDLPRLVTAQPYLLTSSVERNQRTAAFFLETMGLSTSDLTRLVIKDPRLAMSSADTLTRCWGVLMKLYGFSAAEARKMVLRYPALLSLQLVRGVRERLVLFSSELGVPSFPSVYVQDLAKRFPPVLYIDTDLFLRPNIATLNALIRGQLPSYNASSDETPLSDTTVPVLRLSETGPLAPQLAAMLSVFPQLTGYNADTLRRMCGDALQLLTGQAGPVDAAAAGIDGIPACVVAAWEARVAAMVADQSIGQLDLIADHAGPYDHCDGTGRSGRSDNSNLRLVSSQCPPTAPLGGAQTTLFALALNATTLTLTADRAVQTLRRAPWILAYRTQRSQTVLAALAVSLGLNREELSHCVSVYPRLLSLSVDGKLKQVLGAVAQHAVSYLAQRVQDSGARAIGSSGTNRPGLTDRVANPVRCLVREVVLRYPLLLGSSLDRVAERFGAAASVGADWGAYLTALRRPAAQHAKWLASCRLRRDSDAQIAKVEGSAPIAVSTGTKQRTAVRATDRRGFRIGGSGGRATSGAKEEAAGLATRNTSDNSSGPWAGFRLGQVLILAHNRRNRRSNTPTARGCIDNVNVTFPAYPQALHLRPLFEAGDRSRVSAAARRLLNSLLPYRWLASN